MRPVIVTVSSQTTSAVVPVNWRERNFNVGLTVVVSGTLTYSVQYTSDDVQDTDVTPVWFDVNGLDGLTANDDGSIQFPVKAVRLNVTAFTSGSATLTILQAS